METLFYGENFLKLVFLGPIFLSSEKTIGSKNYFVMMLLVTIAAKIYLVGIAYLYFKFNVVYKDEYKFH